MSMTDNRLGWGLILQIKHTVKVFSDLGTYKIVFGFHTSEKIIEIKPLKLQHSENPFALPCLACSLITQSEAS